ncbi:MAG TPA: class I SAM-dependent methyltransferase [Tepidisphaeraceae bacterium]|nr:class I SAM-dependent methyltransferase [Tepidisphaeraceae bacterium]
MNLKSGIPTVADVAQLQATPTYNEYTAYNAAFLARHAAALDKYGRHWGQDPFGMWSRRYEYPYVGEKLLAHARLLQTADGAQAIKILDAGSGVTFLDYYICDQISSASVVCVDYDKSYHDIFAAVNANTPGARVRFAEGMLQDLKFGTGEFDSLACLSVLEHTDNYAQIIKEFARVVKPAGQLVLTFDLSLDGKFPLSYQQAADLLSHVSEYFAIQEIDATAELGRMKSPDGLLTTDYVKQTNPELLPWKFPLLKGVHDLVKGHGWTGGFRSKAVFCLDARRK